MDKYIVITGASSGIGMAAAKAFAAHGFDLILIARSIKLLEKLKGEVETKFGIKAVIKTADLSHTDEVYRVYSELSEYYISAWINNAGFGDYSSVAEQDLQKAEQMIAVDVTALMIFSTLYVRDYRNENTQLINISSAGGYTIVPNAVTYCAAKFFVSAFTEGLARELAEKGCALKAKVLAPAATNTNFGKTASNSKEYDYNAHFSHYHTSEEMADFLIRLYYSNNVVGKVDRETFQFELCEPIFPYSGRKSSE